ncbi:MAG: LacI family DNA-binding transcriptional regulator [Phycisphaeraceae bacterium]|nr:LacI family DNA-binding transcriptional regulator [Phycisphaeraceae bacterium]
MTDSKSPVTLKTIAQQVGVSISTVSAVLNGKAKERRIATETEKLILKATQQLKYHPNFFATQLKQPASKLLVLCMHQISDRHSAITGEAFAYRAMVRGYHVLLSTLFTERPSGRELSASMVGPQSIPGGVPGMAVVSHAAREMPDEWISSWLDRGMAVVSIEHRFNDPRVGHVVTDEFRGGYLSAKHICEQGARNVWIMGGHPNPPFVNNVKGYLAGLKEMNAPEPLVLWSEKVSHDWMGEGYRVMKQALASNHARPDGLLGVGGRLVMAGIHALVEAGLTPGRDFLIVSYHSGDIGEYFNPPLSTVDPPTAEAGSAAADLLIDTLEGKCPHGHAVHFEPELTIRDSSTPAGGLRRHVADNR